MDEVPALLIGSGRAADVFAHGDGLVLRRYRTEHDCRREAEIMELARAHGVPVPQVHRAEGREIVMDRIAGPTMLQRLAQAPWHLLRAADQLAALHQQLHAISYEERRLVHLDLHPANVIMSPAGPVLIDWSNARSGTPEQDVAQTWLIIATSIPDTRSGSLTRLLLLLRGVYLGRFLSRFDRDAVTASLRAVAQERMRDRNVTPAERDEIVLLLKRVGV